uniref:Rod shape-determining protein MreD n=1 Tax=uncultured gamma proteobacterium HF0770_09E07 TaxID=723576 RepID=E7C6P1_9GAMM|nr:hypothetical protein [uncultured gamma proteobacterium HF0770_09E07]|tara:strand:+ start:83 stop:541 length:459 start_codon:yes stop_codon:yes gene_type:complete
MNELTRISIALLLVIANYIFLTIGAWAWLPDIFLMQTLLFTTFFNRIPSVYFFVFKGFLIDLFFSAYSVPYTVTFGLIGVYLNFGNLKWIQRSFLEQIIMIFVISLILNMLLGYFNNYSSNAELRIILNPFLNSLVWTIIFITQRQKWLKNM